MDTNLTKAPTISVLMPVYNAERYLNETIDSILNQTYQDFELIIVNDGSEDKSEEVILSYSDKRIKYYANPKNEGLVKTPNKGIEMCSGKWVARMDADDISLPDRFQKQIDYLESHPEVVMVGGCMDKIREQNKSKRKHNRGVVPNHLIRERMFFGNYFVHSSIMVRRDVLNEFKYNPDYAYAEDYFLCSQIAAKYPVASLPDVLILYRKHSQSVTMRLSNLQKVEAVKSVFKFHLANLQIDPTPEELDLHYLLMWEPAGINIMDPKCRSAISRWIHRLKEQNDKLQVYDVDFFTRRLTYRWSWKKQLHIAFLRLTKGL